MLQWIKDLLAINPPVDFKELIEEGAIIVDVRTKVEYKSGHIKGSVNIPVDQLSGNLVKLEDKNRPIITCCASGTRSGTALRMLKSLGYTNVHNAGSWTNLRQYSK